MWHYSDDAPSMEMDKYHDAELTKTYWFKQNDPLNYHSFIIAEFTLDSTTIIPIRFEVYGENFGTSENPIFTRITPLRTRNIGLSRDYTSKDIEIHCESENNHNPNNIKYGDIGHIYNYMITTKIPFDIFSNNCHIFAHEMYSILTGNDKVQIPDFIKVTGAQLLQRATGMLLSDDAAFRLNGEWFDVKRRNKWKTRYNECPSQFNDKAYVEHFRQYFSWNAFESDYVPRRVPKWRTLARA